MAFSKGRRGTGQGCREGKRRGRGEKNRCGQSRFLHLQMIFFLPLVFAAATDYCSLWMHSNCIQNQVTFFLISQNNNNNNNPCFIPRSAICLISIYEMLFHITARWNRSCMILFSSDSFLWTACVPLTTNFAQDLERV